MKFPIRENTVKTARHTTAFLSCGPVNGTPIVFVHGCPELSISWRHQLQAFGQLGFLAIAPDMRGYGNSSVYSRHKDYAQEQVVTDMIELLDGLGVQKAIWVGHDWGAPMVWSIAQQHPDRCHAIVNLCVPYIPQSFAPEHTVPLANRKVYPEDKYPVAQWDYYLHYRENFAASVADFEANIGATVRWLFRSDRSGARIVKDVPLWTATVRANGGWFGEAGCAPDMPRDHTILSEEEESKFVASFERNGFFGPLSWYMNAEANTAYALRAKDNWRLKMPVLYLHADADLSTEAIDSRLGEPMREYCANLTEAVIEAGHWIQQENPTAVNAVLAKWLAVQLPSLWQAR